MRKEEVLATVNKEEVTEEDWVCLKRECKRMNDKRDGNRYFVCMCGESVKIGEWRLHKKCLGRETLEFTEWVQLYWKNIYSPLCVFREAFRIN